MSVLSSSTTAVHTFGRLMSNRAIRAVSKHCHAQGDSNYRYPWPSLDRLHSLAQSSPIFSLPRARLECSEIIFRFMRSVGVCVLLIIMDGPGEKRLASVKRYEGDPPEGALLRIVSVAEIRPGPRKSVRPFKGIFWDDISEFESSLPSQAVRSLWAMSRSV